MTLRALPLVLLGLSACEREVVYPDGLSWGEPPVPAYTAEARLALSNNGDDTLAFVAPDGPRLLGLASVGNSPVELEGPHHLAVAPDGRYLYFNLSNYVIGGGGGPHGAHGTGTVPGYVVKLDARTNRPLGQVLVDRSPGDVITSSDGKRLYVSHYDLQRLQAQLLRNMPPAEGFSSVAIVDAEEMRLLSMTAICPTAHGEGLSPDGRRLYVTCAHSDEVAVVDVSKPESPQIITKVKVGPQAGPHGAPRYAPYALRVVRRDETEDLPRATGEKTVSCCASPAGESPVRVRARAPGSRPPAILVERPEAEAGRRKPLRREQGRGPQHEVNPAASKELQRGSRASHAMAKATTVAGRSGQTAAGPSGVGGAARDQGEERNTGGPSARPLSGRGGSYKPKAKSATAQRESEGIVVPKTVAVAARTNAVKKNAAGGKGPWGGQVCGAGKREGMAGKTGPNDPGGERPRDKVRDLQRRLWAAAKRAPGRRFHALYDHIWRSDVLQEAWRRVRCNKGAAGVDAVTLAEVEQSGVDRFLEEIGAELREGRYRAEVVLRRYIPKADGRERPLGIPTVVDRVVQMAAKLVLEPIYEADFLPCSYGFRPKRSATMALEVLRKQGAKGGHHVLDADIRDYFDSIDHDKLMKLVGRRVSDRRVLKLLRQWLRAGVMEEGTVERTVSGTPQGGVISPLLSNIYLHVLDELWTRHSAPLGTLVRYADDFVVMCRTRSMCEQAEERIRVILRRLGLELHPEKTRRVELYDGKEGFDFLGCHLHKRLSGPLWERTRERVYFLHRWPNQRAMKRVRQRVKELTPRRRCHADLREVISDLNPVLRGWGSYFRTGNAARQLNQIDGYVWRRLKDLRIKRQGRQLRAGQADRWTGEYFWNLGLHRLRGTIRYPVIA